ncbi:glycosyltransferase family 4 protein [Cerasicoccus fimbriatus]|uniref:glycosyltransferase family 4 protein n=1 Tax=Cerasicoccus fimbriatus TaxID=3014554 RepID=UPI0022B38AC7|nr:glycosyltransferase family 4 protein [Cerasicoccus sp. TK19100]
MRFLLAVSPQQPTGVDSVHYFLANGLKTLGHDCEFITFDRQISPEAQAFFAPCKTIPHLPNFFRVLFPRGRDWSRIQLAYQERKLRTLLNSEAPVNYLCGHLTLLQPQMLPAVTQVGVIHAPDESNRTRWLAYKDVWCPTIAVSQQSREFCFGTENQTTPVITNGVTVPERSPKKSLSAPLKLIWCGRLEDKQKRASDLIEIANRLLDQGVDFTLKIVGEGPLADKLTRELCTAKSRVEITGPLPRGEVWKLMDESHAILMTSNYEGMPMSLLEAMSRGCIPVVYPGIGDALGFVQEHAPDLITDKAAPIQLTKILLRLSQSVEALPQRAESIHRAMQASPYTDVSMAKQYITAIEAV